MTSRQLHIGFLISFMMLAIAAYIGCARPCYAEDTVIIYDTSGSVKWQPNMEELITDVNAAVHDLVWMGKIQNAEKWNISEFPSRDSMLPGGKSMVRPNSDDILIIHPFDEPQQCEPPFFNPDRVRVYRQLPPNWPVMHYLPSGKPDFKGKLSYIRLAKWSAANLISGNSSHKTKPFFLIMVSDLREEAGGNCWGQNLIARKIVGFETLYLYDTFYSATYKKQLEGKYKDGGNYFTIQASIVSYKSKPDFPKEDNPIENPPEPIDSVIVGDLEEPELLKDMDPPPLEDLEEPEKGSIWPWVLGIIAAIGIPVGGLFGLSKLMKRKKTI